jgi:hypothetical protein
MRYAIRHRRSGGFFVIDRRCPLRPVSTHSRLAQALGLALRLSFRSAWGW